jgi:hypothetical protein
MEKLRWGKAAIILEGWYSPRHDLLVVSFSFCSGAKELRIALFTGNYNYINDGVALTLNHVVEYLRMREVPVLVFEPCVERPRIAFSSAPCVLNGLSTMAFLDRFVA